MEKLISRRDFTRRLALAGLAVPLMPARAAGSAPGRIRRIGYFSGAEYPELLEAFKDELRTMGYVEGETIAIEVRLSRQNTADMPALVTELSLLKLELIVAGALSLALQVRNSIPEMPMVIATCPGMIANEFAQSMEHPGGHVTGIDELPPGLTAKRLQLLKAAAPSVSRVALLSTTPGHGGHEIQLADAERAATDLGITVKSYRATSLSELQAALAAIASDGMEGLLCFQGGFALGNRKLIVDFAAEHHLPAIYQATLFAEAGGLMSWAPNLEAQYRVAAHYVDRILKGASPGDLAVTYPPRYYLTVNSSAARNLKLTLPPELLAQAERVLP